MSADSRGIAGLVGPAMIAVLLSENQFVNPHLYDRQIPPVVYLSGALLFIAGLAIVRAHNLWTRGWPVMVTLTGWFALLLGLFRLFAPGLYQEGAQGSSTALLIFEIAGLAVGLVLTYRAYRR